MALDLTAQLAPTLWTLVALLLILGGAIVASIDPELAEVYLGDRRLLLATMTLAVVTLVVLVAARPEIADGIGLQLP